MKVKRSVQYENKRADVGIVDGVMTVRCYKDDKLVEENSKGMSTLNTALDFASKWVRK